MGAVLEGVGHHLGRHQARYVRHVAQQQRAARVSDGAQLAVVPPGSTSTSTSTSTSISISISVSVSIISILARVGRSAADEDLGVEHLGVGSELDVVHLHDDDDDG